MLNIASEMIASNTDLDKLGVLRSNWSADEFLQSGSDLEASGEKNPRPGTLVENALKGSLVELLGPLKFPFFLYPHGVRGDSTRHTLSQDLLHH